MGNRDYLTEDEVRERCTTAHGGALEVVDFSGYAGVQSSIAIRCTRCGNTWMKRVVNIIHRGAKDGKACPKCSGVVRRTPEQFTSEVAEKTGGAYETLSDFTNTRSRVLFRHAKCGEEFWMKAHNFITLGQRCPVCRRAEGKKASKGEERIERYLIDAGIPYVREMTFIDLLGRNNARLAFDFFLKERKLLIEYDGHQHFAPVKIFGGLEYHERCKKHDAMKTEFARSNDFRLIRIPYTDYTRIEKILDVELRNVQRLGREAVPPSGGEMRDTP
jgi:hypothetical protein